MGAGASSMSKTAEELRKMTATDIANLMREGETDEGFKVYADSVVADGIDADCILKMSTEDLDSVISEMKPVKAIHKIKLKQKAALLKEQHSANDISQKAAAAAVVVADASPAAPPLVAVPADILAVDHITRTPRDLITDLFKIQAIRLTPNRVPPAVEKLATLLATTINKAFDGKTRYGAFINYRVAADAAVAEQLHLRLKVLGIHTFLDKECLQAGYPWKDGFVEGVTKSHFFIALISREALVPARRVKADHTYDNVLYEYEIALKIRERMERPDFIIPVLIDTASKTDESRQIQYRDFSDFYPTLYCDSITAKADAASDNLMKLEGEEATPTPVKAAPAPAPDDDYDDLMLGAGCFHGDCTVNLQQRIATVASLKKGDVLSNGDVIECLLETRLDTQLPVPVVRFDAGLIITPWHPVREGNDKQWQFPAQVGTVEKMAGVSSVYSLLVRQCATPTSSTSDEYAQSVTINGIGCITLAAGISDDPVATHAFFGTNQVIAAMKKLSPDGFAKGRVVLDYSTGNGKGMVRDKVTKMIIGF